MEKKNANVNYTKRTQGYTLVELITVLAIMGILGTMLVSMLNIGVQFYRSENSAMENQNNARLAIAYVTVKIRQHDALTNVGTYAISVDSSTYSVPVLKINDASSGTGNVFWIYFDSSTNKLREQSSNTFDGLHLESGTEIAELGSFNIEYKYPNINNIIEFEAKSVDGSVDLTQDITLRSTL